MTNTLIKISTILSIMGLIAMKSGFLDDQATSKHETKPTTTVPVLAKK